MGIYLVFLIFIRTYIINIYSGVFVKFLLLLISSVLISQTAYCLTWKEVSFTRIIIDKKMRMLPSGWQSFNSQEKKALTQFLEYISPNYKVCGSGTIVRFDRNSFYQVKSPKVTIYLSSNRLKEADQLNDITWKGYMFASVEGSSVRGVSESGSRGEWKAGNWYNLKVNYPSKIKDGLLVVDSSASDFLYGSATHLEEFSVDCSKFS
jgi:hypothetical protein